MFSREPASIGVLLDQQLHDVDVAVVAGHDQRRVAVAVRLAYVSALVDQKLRSVDMAVRARDEQRRRAIVHRLATSANANEARERHKRDGREQRAPAHGERRGPARPEHERGRVVDRRVVVARLERPL